MKASQQSGTRAALAALTTLLVVIACVPACAIAQQSVFPVLPAAQTSQGASDPVTKPDPSAARSRAPATSEPQTNVSDPARPSPSSTPAPSSDATAANQTVQSRQPSPPRRRTARFTSFATRRRRLSRAPDMLGDTFLPQFQLMLQPQNPFNGLGGYVQIAPAGGSSRAKISEHNKALPVDRVYANYNHFHNAAQRDVFQPGTGEFLTQRDSVDRFTLGVERTFRDGDSSLELRLPLTAYPDLTGNIPSQGAGGRFESDTGVVGNLSLIGKHLLIDDEDVVVSAGLGVEFPVGADGSALSGSMLFEVVNQALFLQPFVAATLNNGDAFIHSFLQVDIDAGGNSLQITDVVTPGPTIPIGRMRQPTLIHWDTSIGHWLAKSDDDTGITGIAAICEFHLTAAAGDADSLNGVIPNIGGPVNFALQASTQQFPATYLTTGLHVEVCNDTTIRVAGVFPLARDRRRLFDSELLVQIGRRY